MIFLEQIQHPVIGLENGLPAIPEPGKKRVPDWGAMLERTSSATLAALDRRMTGRRALVAALNGGTADFRLSESRAFIEGMTQQMASTMTLRDMPNCLRRPRSRNPRWRV